MSRAITAAVLETDLFEVTPCIDCDVPGYLVLQPKEISTKLLNLGLETQVSLGPLLARLEAALLDVTGADRIYQLRFSEGLADVHFHLFPRTAALAAAWRDSHPNEAQNGNNGPLIFAWARLQYRLATSGRLSPLTLATANQLRLALN